VSDTPRREISLRRSGRSRALATSEDREEYLGFRVSHEMFAVSLALVREILKPPPITEVPRARREILGIISVRGQITTVLDVRRRLNLPPHEGGPAARILLVQGNDEVLGLWVDEVTQVYRLSPAEIEQAAAVLGANVGSHVAGIGRPRIRGLRGEVHGELDQVLILLDLAALLSA
jgi:purine-binding chemotaxis protein CheW